jgi:DNA-binding beta-propeller fold protein YncE
MARALPRGLRGWALRAAAALASLAAVAGALHLANAFSSGDDRETTVDLRAATSSSAEARRSPGVQTIPGVEHPVAVAAVEGGAWVADGIDATASRIRIPYDLPLRTSYSLTAPSVDVAVGEGDAWFALEDRAIERMDLAEPADPTRVIELDHQPAAIEFGAGYVWALEANAVDRIDPRTGEVTDQFSTGGFANALAVNETGVWVISDGREVRRLDPETGEPADSLVSVPDASAIGLSRRYAWVVSDSGAVTRLDPDSVRVVGTPISIPTASAIAIGAGGVWVAGANGTVTRLDPDSAAKVGDPIDVGRQPVSVSATGDVVWVANSGNGTVSRITP